MNSICILLTDHESINESLIIKSKRKLILSKLKKIYFIGDAKNFNKIYLLHKKYQKKFEFIKIELKKKNYFQYLEKITKEGINLFKKKKIKFLINMPLNKKKYLNNRYFGFTEFFSKKIDNKNNENMLLFNNNFSVCPLTTHIQIKDIDKKITHYKIKNALNNIINFYKKIIKKKIKIIVLGLNPHAGKDFNNNSKDKKIEKLIFSKFANKNNIKGPISADTAFTDTSNKVFLGMYHDQVLIPFKMKNRFNGINITIGKKFYRLSPDHGTASKLKNYKKKINNQSLIECIKFCEKY